MKRKRNKTATAAATAKAALAELARRELARRKTLFLLKYFMPQYSVKPVHQLVSKRLDRFVSDYKAGKAPRLIISMPPQHGKSTLVNGMIAGLAGSGKNITIPICSYSADLAERSSLEVFNWLTSDEGRILYPGLFAQSGKLKATAALWQTTNGVTVMARGVGGALTGRPADVLVLDDLHKDYLAYLSNAQREALKSWIMTVAGTRINNETAIILIMTRWGVGDAADMVQKIIPGKYDKLVIPALSKGFGDPLHRPEGEALWPEKHSRERLEATRESIGDLEFAAMYQQSPKRSEGSFFKREKWTVETRDTWKEFPRPIRYWDLGFTKDGHPTAGALLSVAPDNHIWIKDVRRITSLDWPDIKRSIIQQIIIDGYGVTCGLEATGTQIGYGQEIQREMGVRGYQVVLRTSKPDKEADAGAWQSRQWEGMVHLLMGDWTEDFIRRADSFPGEDIDEIDAISGAVATLKTAVVGTAEQGW